MKTQNAANIRNISSVKIFSLITDYSNKKYKFERLCCIVLFTVILYNYPFSYKDNKKKNYHLKNNSNFNLEYINLYSLF